MGFFKRWISWFKKPAEITVAPLFPTVYADKDVYVCLEDTLQLYRETLTDILTDVRKLRYEIALTPIKITPRPVGNLYTVRWRALQNEHGYIIDLNGVITDINIACAEINEHYRALSPSLQEYVLYRTQSLQHDVNNLYTYFAIRVRERE